MRAIAFGSVRASLSIQSFSLYVMTKNEPADITNVMIMEAIHSIKSDVQDLKTDVQGIKQEMGAMEVRLENKMVAMENRLVTRIVEESHCLAKAMIPTNAHLDIRVKKLEEHVGLAA